MSIGETPEVDLPYGKIRKLVLATVGLVALAAILWANFGDELIPVREGIGYDGNTYASIAKDPGRILRGEFSDHHVQRILPSLIVHVALRPFGLQQTDAAIILGFQVLDYLLIALACILWIDIGRRWRLAGPAMWFGVLALFLNYSVAKFPGYYPVLTDSAGFALGAALLWSFVANRPRTMYVVSLLGAITWPLVLYSGLLLLCVRRESPQATDRKIIWPSAVLAVSLALGGLTIFAWAKNLPSKQLLSWVVPSLLPVSAVVLIAYVFLATRPLFRLVSPRRAIQAVNWPAVAVGIGTLVLTAVLRDGFSTPSDLTVSRTLGNVLLGGIQKPGVFLVSSVAYFGPGVLVAILLWRHVAEAIAEEGIGMVLLMLGYVLLTIGAESRIFMSMWPFFVAFTAKAVNKFSWTRFQVLGFAIVSLVASRLWLPIQLGHQADDVPGFIYRASIGWRMPTTTYLIMLGMAVIMCGVMWRLSGPSVDSRQNRGVVDTSTRDTERGSLRG